MIFGGASERGVEVSSSSINAASCRSKAGFVWVYPDPVFGIINNSNCHLVTKYNLDGLLVMVSFLTSLLARFYDTTLPALHKVSSITGVKNIA